MTPEILDMKSPALEFKGQSIHGKQNNTPTSKDVPVLIFRTYDCVRLHGKGGLRFQMELRWLISWF